MHGNKHFLFLFLFIFYAFISFGQQKTKAQLQQERADNLKKIHEASATLNKTSTKKKASVGQLNALKYQISIRQKLIRNIQEEIQLLNGEIKDNLDIISSLEDDVEGLKQEYVAMVYSAYKARNGQDKLTFLFSAESFNQLLRRIEYMEQYSIARKKQVKQITAVQDALLEENATVKIKRQEKSALLGEKRSENASLVDLRKSEQAVLTTLKKEEKQLKKELTQRRESLKALDKLISDLIKREVEEAANATTLANNNAAAALSADFSQNKLKLPWPTDGFVSQKFGRTRDPVLKMVERNSPGIEIQTNPSSEATSVFQGKVTAVALIQGFNKAVIIKHGDYYTVYAKLSEVYVKKGQKVNVGDKVGKIFTSNDGIAELHFELWESKENGTSKLNPEGWLVKK
jgi:septal ring factor EnvC (AmiA/AmiB activator)